jgi:hypothetical protein
MISRRPMLLLSIVAAISLAAGGARVWGQESAATLSESDVVAESEGATPVPAQVAQPKVSGAIEYVGPDTYILLDSEGRPQPVLGMTYEEFIAAWKQLEQVEAASDEPRFTIDELRMTGRAVDDHTELEAVVKVRVLADGLVRVPLAMAGGILREQPKVAAGADDDAATVVVQYDAKAGGFVALIDSKTKAAGTETTDAKQVVEIALRLLVPLVRDGNEISLQLNCPRALVSNLALDLPTAIVDATATEGTLVTTIAGANGGTRLDVDGPAGDFRLRWNTAEAARPELATVLSATGAVGISIDGHSIRSDAHLTVRSYGGSFERFRVRLPPGAKLIEERTPDVGEGPPTYRLALDTATAPASADSQIVTVELAEKQLGPVEIELSTEQPLGLNSAEEAVELAGFEVLGAVRQYGDVAVQVADDWQLRSEAGPYVRQVEPAELAAALADFPATIAYQYDRQPWSLRARVAARPMVVNVTPAYALELDADEARLQAQLVYQVPGARAFEFRVRLEGWELTPDPIESNGLVDRDAVMVSRDGVLVLPLAQASSRRAEVTFQLRRALARNAKEMALALPIPEADSVAAAEVAVSADASIELLPNMAGSRGLSPIPVTSETPVELSATGEQVFRFHTLIPDALFAATRTIRPSTVTAEVESSLAVDWQRLEATQRIDYRVEHQPIEQIALDVPIGWKLVDNQIEITPVGGTGAPIVVAAVAESAAHGRATQVVRATLSQPRMGGFQARVAYQFAEPSELLGVGQNTVPLPGPTARVARHRVHVAAGQRVAVALGEGAAATWREVSAMRAEQSLVVDAIGPQASLPLAMEPLVANRPQDTKVTRAWLQTWQVGAMVQDRAVFQYHTSGSAVTVELPPQVATQEVEVLADGELAHVSARQEGRLIVDVPSQVRSALSAVDATPVSHTLELRYRRPAPLGLIARHEFTPPQLVGSSALSEVYWQVVLPGDRHVVQAPAALVPVEPWQWLEVFAGRHAAKLQSEMEEWAGATNQLAPTEAQNAYLYSGLAPVASIEMLTAPRWLVVLAASGAVLAVVSLWMYVPSVRRGWLGILLAAVVAGLAVAYPAPAVLLGQAAALGVILAGVSMWLQRRLARPVPRPTTTSGSTNLRMRSSLRTDSYLSPSLGAASSGNASSGTTGSGTPTMPLAVPEVDR